MKITLAGGTAFRRSLLPRTWLPSLLLGEGDYDIVALNPKIVVSIFSLYNPVSYYSFHFLFHFSLYNPVIVLSRDSCLPRTLMLYWGCILGEWKREWKLLWSIGVTYWDNGKENGNYYSILGIVWGPCLGSCTGNSGGHLSSLRLAKVPLK